MRTSPKAKEVATTPAAKLVPVTPNPKHSVATPTPKKTRNAVPISSAAHFRAIATPFSGRRLTTSEQGGAGNDAHYRPAPPLRGFVAAHLVTPSGVRPGQSPACHLRDRS